MSSEAVLEKDLSSLGFFKIKKFKADTECIALTALNKKDNKSYFLACYEVSNLGEMEEAQLLNFVKNMKSKRIPSAITPKDVIRTKKHLIITYPLSNTQTLSQFRNGNYISITDGIKWAKALTKAVNDLHGTRLAHLSLSPSLCFVDPEKFEVEILLVDTLETIDQFSTTENTKPIKLNNISYSSPERFELGSTHSDYRSDYYSLGMILYEIFADKHSFNVKNKGELIRLHRTMTPKYLQMINPRVPSAICKIIDTLIKKRPSQRYQNGYVLLKDLERCFVEYREKATIKDFEIGENDVPLCLNVSKKLFGRDKELKLIKSAFAHNSKSKIISINGKSGIGKTALLNVIKTNAKDERWMVLSAKGTEEDKAIPFSILSQIFTEYENAVAQEPLKVRVERKEQLVSIVGPNGHLLNSIFPIFKQLIGDDFEERKLDATASKEQFFDILYKLIAFMNVIHNGLVLVIDDMHWASESDLQFLENISSLINDNAISMNLVVSARDDKEHEDYLNNIYKFFTESSATYTKIELSGLNKVEISYLIADALPLNKNIISNLSEEIMASSQGNPYFIHNYLRYLLEKQIIFFDQSTMQWNILDNKYLKSKNIYDLLDVRIKNFPKQTQEILYYCSFFGTQTELSKLSSIHKLSQVKMLKALIPAIDNDLVYIKDKSVWFKHDRILQYFTNVGTVDERCKATHRIGFKLYKLDKDKNNIFETVRFLNSVEKCCTIKELMLLHGLNLECAGRAIENNAFSLGLTLAEKAMSLLNDLPNPPSAKLQFQTYFINIKTNYLSNNYKMATETLQKLLKTKLTAEQKIVTFNLAKDIYINKGESFNYVVSLGMSIASEIGLNPPENKTKIVAYNNKLEAHIDDLYNQNGIKAFKELPISLDAKKPLYFRFLMDLWEASYYAGDIDLMLYCGLKMIDRSMKTGVVSESAFGFVVLASYYSSNKQYTKAYEFGNLAIKLNKDFDDQSLMPKVTNLFCNYTNFFKAPFSHNLALYDKSADVAKNNSDYLFGIWAVFFRVWSGIICGEPIKDTLAKLEEYSYFIRQTNDEKMQQACDLLRQFLTNFQSNFQTRQGLFNPTQHPTAILNQWEKEGFFPGLTWYAIMKAQALFLNEDYQGAIDVIHKYGQETSLEIVMFPITQYHYIYALSILKLKGKAKGLDAPWMDVVEQNREIIANWVKSSPQNFSHQLFLIDALKSSSKGEQWQAHKYFQKAIKAADKSKSSLNIALCNELAAMFWLESGDQIISEKFLSQSYSAYRQWGAKRKLSEMDSKASVRNLFNVNKHLPLVVVGNDNNETGTDTTNIASDLLDQLHRLSIQTDSHSLFEALINILMSHTGAQQGLFIKDITTTPIVTIDAQGFPLKTMTFVNPIKLSQHTQVSKTIVKNVQNTAKVCLYNSAVSEPSLKKDAYIQKNNVQSVLALPIDPTNIDLGIIYLENPLIKNVFNDVNLELIQILLSQTINSLESSNLYSDLLLQIKEREHVENRLRRSEERMRLGIKLGGIGLWEWNFKKNELFWSETTKNIFGYKDQNIIGTFENFTMALHPDDKDKMLQLIEECIKGKRREFVVEHRVVWADGTLRIVEARGGALRGANNKIDRFTGVVRDITEQRQMEEQIGNVKLMSSLEVLTGGIAHDFNNLLSSILGYGQIMSSTINDKKQKEYLSHIIDAGQRGAILTKKLLSLVGTEKIETKNYDLNALLEKSYDVLSKTLTATNTLTYKLQAKRSTVKINLGDFNDVILNLVVNSKLAMPKGGELIISTFLTAKKATIETINKQLTGEYIAVEFLDSGIGIDPDILPDVIKPFYSTRKDTGGTGLGLSQVYAFVERSGGGITIQSKPSSGTKITLYLPVSSAKLGKIENVQQLTGPKKISKSKSKKILIVEDEKSLGLLMTVMLDNLGYDSVCVDNTDDALDFLSKNSGVDIVITDLIMPGKFNGSDLIFAIQKMYPEIKCQLMSGYIHPDILNKLDTHTKKNILSKPFSQDELDKAISKSIAG